MKRLAVLILALFALSCLALAHPGRTDRFGGHRNRKMGGYHYHNKGYVHIPNNPYQKAAGYPYAPKAKKK